MAFESLARMKEYSERMHARMAHLREKGEQMIERGIAVAEINVGLLGWGYANERWGDTPADTQDANALKELTVAKVPADLGVGIGLLAVSMLGGLGKYAEHGMNLGNASTGAFMYRTGAELGRRALSDGSSSSTSTQGVPRRSFQATMGASGPRGGQVHHVQYR